MKRHADPMAALLGTLDSRVAQHRPMMSQLGTVTATAPALIVKLDAGQEMTDPYVVLPGTLAIGARVVMIPTQQGHDFALYGPMTGG